MDMQEFVDDQVLSPELVAGVLRTTAAEIASTLGICQDAFSPAPRLRSLKTQTRRREMMEILRRVQAHTGCAGIVAYAWFRSEPLSGLDCMTPVQLVRRGNAEYVIAYLDQVVAGGYA